MEAPVPIETLKALASKEREETLALVVMVRDPGKISLTLIEEMAEVLAVLQENWPELYWRNWEEMQEVKPPPWYELAVRPLAIEREPPKEDEEVELPILALAETSKGMEIEAIKLENLSWEFWPINSWETEA